MKLALGVEFKNNCCMQGKLDVSMNTNLPIIPVLVWTMEYNTLAILKSNLLLQISENGVVAT